MSNLNPWANMDAKSPYSDEDYLNISINLIEDMLKYREDFSAGFGGSNEKIQNAYRIVKEQLKQAVLDQKIIPSSNDKHYIFQSIDILTELYMFGEITKIVVDFSKQYLKLVNNWNSNILKDEQLKIKLVFLNRLIEMKLSIDDTIFVMQTLCKRLKKYAESEPPGYSLSRHYLGSLDAINKPKDDKCAAT